MPWLPTVPAIDVHSDVHSPGQPGSESDSLAVAIFRPFRDAWLAARARFTVLAEAGSAAGHVNVEAFRSKIILTGDVPSRETSDTVERAARRVPGVVGISNQLRIRGDQCLRSGSTDAEIRTAVTARLRTARELRGSIIVVDSVYDGVVRLTGGARDAVACNAAFALAVDVVGVRRLINDVTLQPTAYAESDADAA